MEKNHRIIREKEGQKKPTRYYSTRQEKRVAKEIGAVRTANSGATMFSKGDLLSEKFIIECKTKTKECDSISIKKEWLTKGEREALFMGKQYFALAFDFGDGDTHYIIDKYLFEELLDRLNDN